MTDPIIAFLRARLDEDEQAARRVASSWRQIGDTGVIVASDGGRAEECANGNWTGIAEHIVRHDPARVLAEVEAKRRALTLHEAEPGQHPDFCGYDKHQLPCPALRLAALPYAGHPDYRDEWKR